jgi:hypothetical protein
LEAFRELFKLNCILAAGLTALGHQLLLELLLLPLHLLVIQTYLLNEPVEVAS